MQPPKDSTELLDLVRGYQGAALIFGLVELDLPTVLAAYWQEGATAEDLAGQLGLAVRPLGAMLDAAVALGLLKVEEGRYRNSERGARYLSRQSGEYLGAQIRTQTDQSRGWLALPQAVREGRTVLPSLHSSEGVENDPALRRLILGLDSGGKALLPKLTPLLDPYLKEAGRLLDIGCGAGTFGEGWASYCPQLTVDLLDKPAVLEIAREVTANSPALSRLRFWPADYSEADFGERVYDLILFFQVLRTESPATIQTLLNKAAKALAPGGHIAIYDTWLESDRGGPLENVFHNLTMALMYQEGAIFTQTQLAGWLAEAGLTLKESWPVTAARPMRLYLVARTS